MQIDEIYYLGKWIEKNYIKNRLNKFFQQLISILNNNSQANQATQPFEEPKQAILKSLKNVDFCELSEMQMNVLRKFELDKYFGVPGADFLEDCLFRNSLDIKTANTEIQKQNSQIHQCYTALISICKSLEAVFSFDEVQSPEPLIRVHFQLDSEIRNLVDYKKWINIWCDIGRGFARLFDSTSNEIRVISTDRGSLIITLGTIAGVVFAMSKAILKLLDSVKRIYEIRAESERVKRLKLKNTKIAIEILSEIDNIKEEVKSELIKEMIETYAPKKDGEIRNDLSMAVEKLVDFLDKGGLVDFYLPPSDNKDEETEDVEEKSLSSSTIRELSDNVERIRQIELEIQQIEHTQSQRE